ncbi:MAG: response regulator [Phycisphaerales bacterium]
MLASTDFIDTLRLPAQEAIDLLDAQTGPNADTRGQRFRRPNVPMHVRHRTGEEARYLVFGSQLWAGGMSVLHGGYLHPGVHATVRLSAGPVERDLVSSVIHCSHLQGRAHLLELAFEAPLEDDALQAFVEPGKTASQEAPPDPATIAGSVLHIDESSMDHRLLAHHLEQTSVTLSHAATGDAAIECVRAGGLDAVICELKLGDTFGERLIGQIRAERFRGPIAVITGVKDKARLRAAMDAGACDVLLKPFQPDRLLRCLARMLPTPARVSTAKADPMRRRAARIDARTIRATVADLPRAITARDYDLVERLCAELHKASKSLGVHDVADAAGAVLASLQRSGSVVGAAADLRSLIERCQAHLAT